MQEADISKLSGATKINEKMFFKKNEIKFDVDCLKSSYESELMATQILADSFNQMEQARYEREKAREKRDMEMISKRLKELEQQGVDQLDPRYLFWFREGFRISAVKPPQIITVYG